MSAEIQPDSPETNSNNSHGQQQQINNNADNQLEASTYNHQCYICDKIFSANSNLNRHLRKIHKENVQSPYNNVKCALCESVFSSSSIYNQHLEKDHRVQIEFEQLTFQTKESFEEWKHGVENETTSQFIKSRGEKKSKNVNKTYYSCNRSGYYVSKARTRKALKKQGSRKINGRCPASMNVTVNNDLSYDVRFVKTHVGHSFELKHLDLSDKDRNLIVQKLVSGLTKKDIIKQIRSAVDQQQPQVGPPASISPASSNVSTNNNLIGGGHASGTLNSNNTSSSTSSIEIVPATNEIVIPNIIAHPSNIVTLEAKPSTTLTPTTINENNSSFITINTINSQPTSRLYLATTKDIHNIINSKHLDSKLIRHNYDLNNFEAWKDEMKEFNEDSSVLYYKSQSELDDRFPKLREDDFMMILMKDGQAEILRRYGDKCIVIDSTHNIHCEYLQLALVSVVDDDGKGFPVAILFSTRTDEDTLEVFFRIIKEKVGTISTRMMIADDLDDFYQAWTKVMSHATHNLLTPWNVFDEWSKRFDLISNREKLRRLKKSLRALLTESETDKFDRALKQIITEYKGDPEVDGFVKFFEERYARNPDVWSSCLRKIHGASNCSLWRLHDKFKAIYKEGKNSKKLCKYMASLMKLFDDSQLERLSKIEDKNPNKMKALNDRHRKSVETGSLVYEVAVDPVYWLCPSESSNEVYYEVTKSTACCNNKLDGRDNGDSDNVTAALSTTQCSCDLKCPTCKTCRHEYQCTCLDFVVNLNMCKHIHRICTMCK